MNLIEKLKQNNYSLVASNGYYSCDSGIKPIINKMNEDIRYFKDLEIADKIVGKASSMLLILSGIKKINAIVLSKQAKNILDKYNIEYTYEQLVEYIINRKKDGMCPMEETVKDINDLNEAFIALNKKITTMANSK
jgi:hypothetical protein